MEFTIENSNNSTDGLSSSSMRAANEVAGFLTLSSDKPAAPGAVGEWRKRRGEGEVCNLGAGNTHVRS